MDELSLDKQNTSTSKLQNDDEDSFSVRKVSSSSSLIEPPSNSEMIDKLRTIKPFNEKQLLSFYQNSLLENNAQFVEDFIQVCFFCFVSFLYFLIILNFISES